MKSKALILPFLFVIISSTGCQSNNKTEERLKRLEKENAELKKTIRNEENSTSPETLNDNSNLNSSKYAFVVLKVSQREYNENYTNKITKIYNYCSGIKSFTYLNEDLKYKFMDAVQSSYNNSAGANLYDGTVLNRNVYVFGSYEEASIEREKYTVTKN